MGRFSLLIYLQVALCHLWNVTLQAEFCTENVSYEIVVDDCWCVQKREV